MVQTFEQMQTWWDNAVLEATDVERELVSDERITPTYCKWRIFDDHIMHWKFRTDGGNVLEIGSGTGRVLNYIGDTFPKTICVGRDISKQMVAIAEQNAPSNTVYSHITNSQEVGVPPYVLVGDEHQPWDLIYAIQVFQHLDAEHVATYIHDAVKALRQGGWFVFQTVADGDEGPMNYLHSDEFVHSCVESAGVNVRMHTANYYEWGWHWHYVRRWSDDAAPNPAR